MDDNRKKIRVISQNNSCVFHAKRPGNFQVFANGSWIKLCEKCMEKINAEKIFSDEKSLTIPLDNRRKILEEVLFSTKSLVEISSPGFTRFSSTKKKSKKSDKISLSDHYNFLLGFIDFDDLVLEKYMGFNAYVAEIGGKIKFYFSVLYVPLYVKIDGNTVFYFSDRETPRWRTADNEFIFLEKEAEARKKEHEKNLEVLATQEYRGEVPQISWGEFRYRQEILTKGADNYEI